MTDESLPRSTEPDPVTDALQSEHKHFQQRYDAIMTELSGKEYPMTENDLVLFRESLLDLPPGESGTNPRHSARQAALDSPEKLRELYQHICRQREAVERMTNEHRG